MSKMTLFWAGLAILVVGGIAFSFFAKQGPGRFDPFASCLKEKGVTYFGAFWCPNCQQQNKMFGKSKPLLPYIECSTPDGKNQVQVCKDKNITNYPTWEFADGSRLIGVQQLSVLAEKTGCTLPQ